MEPMNKFTEFQLLMFEKHCLHCHDVEDLLGDYVDGDLPASLKERVDDHIAQCEDCTDALGAYQMVIELAGEISKPPTPIEVKNRLRAKLNKELGLSMEMVAAK
jgi:anti-sigma factor RsiW